MSHVDKIPGSGFGSSFFLVSWFHSGLIKIVVQQVNEDDYHDDDDKDHSLSEKVASKRKPVQCK